MSEQSNLRLGWVNLVGQPHDIGIELNVGVSDTQRKAVEYQVRGIVDVPTLPYGDDERRLLAKVLINATDIPEKQRRVFWLYDWVATDGGSGVSIRSCGPLTHLTGKDIIDFKIFTAPDVEELEEEDTISSAKHYEWTREYQMNRYCRYESRQDLHQRWQDIQVNTQVLKPSGKMGLTSQVSWYRLAQHVITEMLLRGEPPNRTNRDPRVRVARPFFDGDLCRKAAAVASARKTGHGVVVKYGKYQYMKDLYERGHVFMNVASDYDKANHNPAVRDDERSIVFRGGYYPRGRAGHFYTRDTVPDNIEKLIGRGEASFSTIYECPDLQRRGYAAFNIEMLTDYWMFCMAGVLDQRLFADFEADCCVIIERKPFAERLLRSAKSLLPNGEIFFDTVDYVDPLGALSSNVQISRSLPVYLTKLFRYTYQEEIRFVCVPNRYQGRLETKTLEIGPISDIAELVSL